MPRHTFNLKAEAADSIRFAIASFTRRFTTSYVSLRHTLDRPKAEALDGKDTELIDACGFLDRRGDLRISIATPPGHSIPPILSDQIEVTPEQEASVSLSLFDSSAHPLPPHLLIRQVDDLASLKSRGGPDGVVLILPSGEEPGEAAGLLSTHLGGRIPLFTLSGTDCKALGPGLHSQTVTSPPLQALCAASFVHRYMVSALQVVPHELAEEAQYLREILREQLFTA